MEQQMILIVFLPSEREQRRVARLQTYLLSFEHAQAWLYFHCSGKSPSCDLKVKLYLLFTAVFKGESCKTYMFLAKCSLFSFTLVS